MLKYITRHTTEELIADYLAGKDLNLTEKRDTSFYVGRDRPINVGLNAIHGGNFGISSYMAEHDNSVYNYSRFIPNGYSTQDTASVKSYTASSASIHRLYKFAYDRQDSGSLGVDYFADSRIILEVADPEQYLPVRGHISKNVYDFQLIVKSKSTKFAQLIDESGIDPETMVDITMNIAFDTDLKAVNRSLAPYGLVVEKATRKKEVIVLKE